MTPVSTLASIDPATAPGAPAATGLRGRNGMALATDAARRAAVKHTAQDFEAFFVTSMFESMSAGLKPDKLFGGGPGESMYRSLLNQEYGKSIAAKGTLGITDEIEREMMKLQEKADS